MSSLDSAPLALAAARAAARPPLVPERRPATVPLSFAQERIWLIDQRQGGSPEYNVPVALRLRGVLAVASLARAVDMIVERHETLRTRFVETESGPIQVVEPTVQMPIAFTDLSDDPAAADAVEAITAGERHAPFDLRQAPLMRLHLIRLAEREHLLLRTSHHIVDDAWSVGIFARELATLYGVCHDGLPSPLAALDVQYADFTVWQRQCLRGPAFETKLEYWRDALADLPERLDLPSDRPPGASHSVDGGLHEIVLPREQVEALKQVSAAQGATLYMSLLTLFAVLLSRYSGQNDIVIGTPIANRQHSRVEPLIGFFVNILVMRVRLAAHVSFRDLLAQVRDTTLAAYRNQDVPFQRLLEELGERRPPGASQPFQVSLAMQNVPTGTMRAGELSVESPVLRGRSALFDLELYVVEDGDTIGLSWVYQTGLFDAWRVAQICRHYCSLLAEAVANPHRPIEQMAMLDRADRQVLEEWNATGHEVKRSTIPDLFEAQVARTPDAVAVTSESAAISYSALNDHADRLADTLRSRGARPETVIGIALDRSVELVIAILAALKTGAAYLPLDRNNPAARLQQILADAVPCVVIADGGGLGPWCDTPTLSIVDHLLESHPVTIGTERARRRPSSEHPAYVLYTSGSTGTPKGVAIPHDAAVNHMQWMADVYPLSADDRVLQKTALTFDASVWELFAPLLEGACLVMARPAVDRDPARLAAELDRYQITVLQVVPSVLAELMHDRGFRRCRTLRRLFCGGEPLDARLANQFMAASPATLINLYGPTEACVDATSFQCVGPITGPFVPIGTAIWNTQLLVLDALLRPVPLGVPGELCIAGRGLAIAYVNRPALTAESFVANPYGPPGSRMYRTGDLVVWRPDGAVEFIRRIDEQVKVRGVRIELGEIVAAVQADPDVRDAIAFVHRDGGHDHIVAYAVRRSHDTQRPAQTDAYLSEWRQVHALQGQRGDATDFDIIGWNSSYTGMPIRPIEMQRWVDETVANLQQRGRGRVLEIGCGTGLLLTRLAPHSEHYTGTDFSAPTLAQLQRHLDQRPDLANVTLREATADDLDWVPSQSVDLVILNSVAQYFPDVNYFLTVLAQAIRATANGGRVFVGDLRNLALLNAFHASVEAYRADPDTSLGTLAMRVGDAVRFEKELVLAPALFEELASGWERIARVELQPKLGDYDNELSRFRYDVTVHVGAEKQRHEAPSRWVDWDQQGQWRDTIREWSRTAADGVGLRRIRDRRVADAVATARAIDRAHLATIELLRAAPHDGGGEDVQQIRRLAGELELDVLWGAVDAGGEYDVVFGPRWRPRTPAGPAAPADWDSFGNNPARAMANVALEQSLRERLRLALPATMIPSVLTVLDAWPLTAHGKLDRRALPAPYARAAAPWRAPRTPDEEILCEIFAEVLGVARVGLDDNFFNLGGHSLTAARAARHASLRLGREIGLKAIFDAPTVGELAAGLGLTIPAPERIDAQSRPAILPVSYAQEALLARDRLQGATPEYNIPSATRLRGRLDIPALRRALRELAVRHEVLRTRFDDHEGGARQIVGPVDFPLPVEDLSALAPDVRNVRVTAAVRAEQETPFDLRTGPVVRARLLRLAPDDHMLLRTTHHIASDGWSEWLLNQELSVLYNAFRSGRASPLASPRLQYSDFVLWERRRLDNDRLAAGAEYWRTQLRETSERLELPIDRARPARQTYRAGALQVGLSANGLRAVSALSRMSAATPYMTLLAAFGVVLARHSGQDDFVVGTPVTNRPHAELEDVVGFFVNALPMRLRGFSNTTFRTLLEGVRQTALAAYQHQEVPFHHIVQEVAPRRSADAPPVFQVMFALQNAPAGSVQFDDLEVESVRADLEVVRFDIELHVFEGRSGDWCFEWRYNRDLFDHWRIQCMARHLIDVIEAVVERPDAALATIDLLDSRSRQQVLHEFNATAHPEPPALVPELFERQCAATPDRVAVVCGDQCLTYSALALAVDRVSRRLTSMGVAPASVIGVALEPSMERVIAILSVLKSGRAYCPIDHTYPAGRLSAMLDDACPALVLTSRAVVHQLPGQCQFVVLDAAELTHAPGGASLDEAAASRLRMPRGDDAAYVLYTSGSTGEPKGIVGTHVGLGNRLGWWADTRASQDAGPALSKSPIGFIDASTELLGPLVSGGTVVIASATAASDQHALCHLIARHRIGRITVVPTLLRAMLADCGGIDLASCRVWISSGEELRPADVVLFTAALPGATLFNLYGSSEASGDSTCAEIVSAAISIGRPIRNTAVYIVDDALMPVPLGVRGELCIAGLGLARGYLHRPALTGSRFVPSPFGGPGERMFRTGDLAAWSHEGQLTFYGRRDRQVKIRGVRIELGEIEAALIGHRGVADAVACISGGDNGDARVVAYVVPEPSGWTDAAEVLRAIRSRLPQHAIPSLVVLDRLPVTATGKLDRRALPAPDAASKASPVQPRTAEEALLCQIFAEILGVADVGIDDDFFALGGHSLTATRAMNRINQQCATTLAIGTIFDAPTVRELGAVLSR